MKIAIIIKYVNINSYENLKFRSTCAELGIALNILDRDKFTVLLDDGIKIYYDNKPLSEFDYIIPRTGSATNSKDAQIYDCMRLSGLNILNDGQTINTLMDKFKVHSLLTANKIPNIKTLVYKNIDDISVIEANFSYPLILKSNTGSLGWGIYKVNNQAELTNMLNIAFLTNANVSYLVQEFISDNQGEDYRVFMYKDKIVGSMKRMAADGDFITNFSKHNLSVAFEVPDEVYQMCIKIMKVLNCDIAGIDLLIRDGQWIVCEVNSAPGFKGLENANKSKNIVKELIRLIKDEK